METQTTEEPESPRGLSVSRLLTVTPHHITKSSQVASPLAGGRNGHRGLGAAAPNANFLLGKPVACCEVVYSATPSGGDLLISLSTTPFQLSRASLPCAW